MNIDPEKWAKTCLWQILSTYTWGRRRSMLSPLRLNQIDINEMIDSFRKHGKLSAEFETLFSGIRSILETLSKFLEQNDLTSNQRYKQVLKTHVNGDISIPPINAGPVQSPSSEIICLNHFYLFFNLMSWPELGYFLQTAMFPGARSVSGAMSILSAIDRLNSGIDTRLCQCDRNDSQKSIKCNGGGNTIYIIVGEGMHPRMSLYLSMIITGRIYSVDPALEGFLDDERRKKSRFAVQGVSNLVIIPKKIEEAVIPLVGVDHVCFVVYHAHIDSLDTVLKCVEHCETILVERARFSLIAAGCCDYNEKFDSFCGTSSHFQYTDCHNLSLWNEFRVWDRIRLSNRNGEWGKMNI